MAVASGKRCLFCREERADGGAREIGVGGRGKCVVDAENSGLIPKASNGYPLVCSLTCVWSSLEAGSREHSETVNPPHLLVT